MINRYTWNDLAQKAEDKIEYHHRMIESIEQREHPNKYSIDFHCARINILVEVITYCSTRSEKYDFYHNLFKGLNIN